jgi:hypothetical protein
MQRRVRALSVVLLSVGLITGLTPLLAASAEAATTTTPTRYVRQVCAALNTWNNISTRDDSGALKALNSNKKSLTSTRRAIAALYTSQMKATDRLITTTKAIGVPRLSDGQQVAADYLQTLGDVRAAYKTARDAALHAPISSKTAFAKAMVVIDGQLATQTEAVGDPLTALNTEQTLATAIQGDAGCGTVLQSYQGLTTSGLKVGDCITADETKVSCSVPHDGEVTLVTSYPASSADPYPGNDAMNAFVDRTCDAAFTSYMGISSDQSIHTYGSWYPNPGADWTGGDREVVCDVTNADNTPIIGTVKNVAS